MLAFEIAKLEAEIASAIGACPSRQGFEIEALRRRLVPLRVQAERLRLVTSRARRMKGARRVEMRRCA